MPCGFALGAQALFVLYCAWLIGCVCVIVASNCIVMCVAYLAGVVSPQSVILTLFGRYAIHGYACHVTSEARVDC